MTGNQQTLDQIAVDDKIFLRIGIEAVVTIACQYNDRTFLSFKSPNGQAFSKTYFYGADYRSDPFDILHVIKKHGCLSLGVLENLKNGDTVVFRNGKTGHAVNVQHERDMVTANIVWSQGHAIISGWKYELLGNITHHNTCYSDIVEVVAAK